jgi:Tubulin-tyrosine ligase family
MDKIKDIVVKTLITAQPYLSHLYKVCQPECLDNSMCFQILGFDVLIDSKFKPYLLEVNASPSFGTDSSLDYKIKKNVIGDAFRMLNFSYAKRQ